MPIVQSGEEAKQYIFPKIFKNDKHEKFISLMRGISIDDMLSNTPSYLENTFNKFSTISQHRGPGHLTRKKELLSLIPEKSSMKETYDLLVANGKIEKYRHLFPNTIYGSRNRRLSSDLPSYTITSHCLDEMIHPTLNRAITPREAARLQSFPDWYEFAGPYVEFHGSKEEDKYEQIGDAIPPLLAYAIAKEFVNCLINNKL